MYTSLSANPRLLVHEHVRRSATGHGATPEQALFRALTQLGVVPLTGTTSEQHMREDLAIFESRWRAKSSISWWRSSDERRLQPSDWWNPRTLPGSHQILTSSTTTRQPST